ncbi:TonB-dependent receptor [Sphingomonas sp. AP4-R1]|uniref:TonB-dependent receptor n=1 Tax=Sphingomonas sp. AP4-R1 TaxID=2735134 RepID=UPI001493A9CD|nr:TonB-dependent receptor [Sphingomonas sp. AP4-R1]QJU59483.1 TonB-dependent receptor [Sphingomonas sp. AP4-R1]
MRSTTTALTALVFAMLAPGAARAEAPDAVSAAEGAEAGLPDVVVTARRRTEDAQSVPGALSVVDAELLQRSYTVNTQGLSLLVPSVNYSSANPRNTAFTIRGLGSSVVAVSQANDGLEPGVGFYIDQVYHARPATAAFDFSDIEQIEVLRGPQGTLFGKNTTAGAISITSKEPSFTPEGSAELSYGNYRFLQVRASASAPIIDDVLAIRLSGLSTRRDGVIRNVRGGDHNGIGNQAVRGQLLWKPTATFKFKLIADYTGFSSNCCTQVYLRVGQSQRAAARQFPALAAGLGYAPPSTNAYDRVTDIDAQLDVSTSEGGVTGIADWDIGPATITSVTGWRFWDWDAANDRDYTGVPIQITQHIPSLQHQFSQELRVASNGDHALSYVAGLYYFQQSLIGHPISIYGPQATYWLLGPASQYPQNLLDGYGTNGTTDFRSKSYAAFGEVNWKILPRLTATGGLRYTYEHKTGSYDTFVFGGLPTTNTTLVNAKLSILRPQTYAAKDNDGSLSGRANLSYQLTDGIMGYASFARGFKSGGINMSGLALTSTNQPALSTAVVRPEKNTTWEAGVKTRLFDRRLILNADAYYTRVTDFQATIVDSSQTVALRGYLSNIPKVVVKGVEVDATALVTRTLSLRGALEYAHGRYADYPAGPCPLEFQTAATTACNLTGRRLSGLPTWAATIGGDWTPAVSAAGRSGALVLHADSAWRSGYYGDPSLSRYTFIRGYNVTNASLGYRDDKGWEVAVFARNLFNTNYIQNLTIQAGNSGLILGTPSDPRTYGVTLRVRT